MSNALAWIKSNVVIVLCLLVMVIAMVSLVWPTGAANTKFQKELDARPQQLAAINGAINRGVPVPAQEPGAPPETKHFTVNDAAVQQLQSIFQQMNSNYSQLYQYAVAFNRAGPGGNNPHKPMIDGLFGVPHPREVVRIAAVNAYARAVRDLYNEPGLRAGTPPTDAQIQQLLDQVQADFVKAYLGAAGPNAATDPELIRLKAERQRDLLIKRAQSIGVYMQPPPRPTPGATGTTPASTSIQVTALLNMSQPPDMALLWESQMQLWIQQGLLYAVAMANHAAAAPPPAPESAPSNGEAATVVTAPAAAPASDSPSSVLRAPVKRILAMTVKPGYVTVGNPTATPGNIPTSAAPQPVEDINKPLADNFVVSPTGRRSNPLYDVRMATLSVLIDSRRIPALLNAIAETNFMTPIIDKITTVDQLTQAASDGYIYGDNADVVRLDLTIETIWLRSWTAGQTDAEAIAAYKRQNPNDVTFKNLAAEEQVKYLKQNNQYNLGLMPDAIRVELGLPPRDPNFHAGPATPEGPGGMGRPGMGAGDGFGAPPGGGM